MEKWEKLHILVNNAGSHARHACCRGCRTTTGTTVINTNLRGTFLFTRAVTRPMMQARYRSDHQYFQRVGADGQSGAVELLGVEGRHDRVYAHGGTRIGQPQSDGQRRGARLHRNRNDRRPWGRS